MSTREMVVYDARSEVYTTLSCQCKSAGSQWLWSLFSLSSRTDTDAIFLRKLRNNDSAASSQSYLHMRVECKLMVKVMLANGIERG